MYLGPHEIYQVALVFLLLTYKVAGINPVMTSWELNETYTDMSDISKYLDSSNSHITINIFIRGIMLSRSSEVGSSTNHQTPGNEN